jgi:hypothetical protein
MVNEMQCTNCGIIHLLGEKFNGQRCCDNPRPCIIGMREIVEYKQTIEEERAEVMHDMAHPS